MAVAAGVAYVDIRAGSTKPLVAGVRVAARTAAVSAQKTIATGIAAGMTAAGASAAAAGKGLSKKLTLPLVGVGALAVKTALDYDKAMAVIRTGTGATGSRLASLGTTFENVNRQVGASTADVARVIADLNTRTGASGPQLEAMALQMLRLARITGTDVKPLIQQTTRVFGDWGIAAAQQSGALDYLFKVTQATGIGINELAAEVVRVGAPMRQLGFSFEQTAALIGKFEKEGVNGKLVLGSLRISLGKMARAGEAPVATFRRVVEQIKNAGSVSKANAIAFKLFGARAGPDMAAAIREGRFAIDDLVKSLQNSPETIAKASKESRTLAGRLQLLKKQAQVALVPLGRELVRAGENLLPVLIRLTSTFTGLVQSFNNASPAARNTTAVLLGLAVAAGPVTYVTGRIITGLGSMISATTTAGRAMAATGRAAFQTAAGFRNVNRAYAANATLSTRLGAALRSQLMLWRQHAAAIWASTRATTASAAAAARSRAAQGSAWIARQAAATRALAAAKLADARASAASAAAAGRQRAAAAGAWIAQQAAALRAVAAANLAAARASTAAAVAAARQKIAAIAVRTATLAWAAAQWVWNVAMAANPIGLAVIAIAALVAAVILAWKKSDTFRRVVTGAFEAIRRAVVAGIGFAVRFVRAHWRLLITILLGPLGLAVVLVTRYWRQISGAVSGAVSFALNFLRSHWRLIISLLGGPLGIAIALVTRYWGRIRAIVSGAVRFVTGFVRRHWRLLVSIVGGPLVRIVLLAQRHWGRIRSITTSVLGAIRRGVSSAMNAVTGAFRRGVRGMEIAWGRLRGAAKRPVNFLISTVYNRGIRGLWNRVMGWLHLPKGLHLPALPQLAAGGPVPVRPGMFSRPTAIVGEGRSRHPEYVIPTDPKYRGRARALWAAAGGDLQMLARGGVLGGITSTVTNVARKVTGLGKNALALLASPGNAFDRLAKRYVPSAAHLGTDSWGKAIAAVPGRLLAQVKTAALAVIKAFSKGWGGDALGVVAAARKYIGKGDDRGRDNDNMFTRMWGYPPGTPWCALFVSTAIKDAKAAKHYPGYPTAAVRGYSTRMRQVGTGEGRPGDLAIYGGGTGSHINLIEKRGPRGGYWTIGGNQNALVQHVVRGGQTGVLRPMARGGILRQVFKREATRNADPHEPTPLTRLYAGLPAVQAAGLARLQAGLRPGATALPRELLDRLLVKALPLGTGGVVDRPTFALIGERGPEAVVPLRRTPSTRQLEQLGRSGGQSGMQVVVNARTNADPHAIGRAISDRFTLLASAGIMPPATVRSSR